MLYANTLGHVGSLVDYSGKRTHTKHSTICVNPSQSAEYQIPTGYKTDGVSTSSAILQRILREYKNISKRVILTGNPSYLHGLGLSLRDTHTSWKTQKPSPRTVGSV